MNDLHDYEKIAAEIIMLQMRLESIYLKNIGKVENPKHKTNLTEKYDKIVHYHYVATRKINEMNEWLRAFGAPEEKQ